MTIGNQGKSALVVDDLDVMRRSVANLLRNQGLLRVDEVSSVPEALEQMDVVGGYDLVVSDWNMDPMTGLDLLKAVRSDPRYAKLAFVLMTAEPTAAKRAEAIAAGASGFLVKPFTAAVLVSEVERVIGVD